MNDGLFLALVSKSRPQKRPPVALPDVDDAELIDALAERLVRHAEDGFERLMADVEASADDQPPSVA